MSVADFFRDARVKGALAGDKSSCDGLLAAFFADYGYGLCTPQQLLALSDLAMRCGDFTVAREALERAVQSGQALHQAFYRLGRLALQQNDSAGAARQFHLGTEADPEFAFNWMGSARALHGQGQKDAAVAVAERFIGFGVRPHAPPELGVIADLADYLFEMPDRARARRFYEFTVKFGAERPRDAMRLANILAQSGEHASVQDLLLAQQQRGRLDRWGQRELAVSFSQTGEHARALELAEAALVSAPQVAAFVSAYIDVLARRGDVALMAGALERNEGLLGPDGAAELRARICMEHDLAGAVAALEGRALAPAGRLFRLAYELAYAALAAGDTALAQALAARLEAAAPDDTQPKLLRVDACFRAQSYEDAGAILARLTPAQRETPQAVLKRFEYACFAGDTGAAEALCARLQTMDLPGRQFWLPVFRFLAEQQRWNDVVDRALPWIDAAFDYRQIGYVLFRAAKYTRRQADMIAAIEAVAGWAELPDLARLRASLALDLARGASDIDALAQQPGGLDAVWRRRLAVSRGVFAAGAANHAERAVLLCSDANYLCGTFVALHSIMHAVARRGIEFFIAVDDGLAGIAGRAAAPFIAAGLRVTVLPAAQIVPDTAKLSPDYGLFTSGHRLAAAAYYRIYAAKYVRGLGRHGRAVYLDSDILLRGRIDPLFEADMAGLPLAAKPEPARPEVRRAIALHGLEDGRYFNSGVLLFDMRHENLAASLDAAIAAVADGKTRLLFHDQCALNLGFRAGFADLDVAWNTVVTESTALADVPAEAAVLHFLERPKPWSAAYGGDAAVLWAESFSALAAFIGEALALELLALVRD